MEQHGCPAEYFGLYFCGYLMRLKDFDEKCETSTLKIKEFYFESSWR